MTLERLCESTAEIRTITGEGPQDSSMTTKRSLRRRFVGGGVVSVLLAVVLVALSEGATTPAAVVPIAWLVAGGGALLVAGRTERLPLGVTTVGWPRVAAVGLAVLSIGSSTIGFLQFLTGPAGFGWLTGTITLVVALLLALATLECWLGGVGLDEEAFAVE